MSGKLRLVNVERGGIRTLYSANIEWNGRIVGYVQRTRRSESYFAYSGGKLAARAHLLSELREELHEVLTLDPPAVEDEETP